MAFRFEECEQITRWNGRYAVIPGGQSKFHVRSDGRVDLRWCDNGNQLTCDAIMNDDLRRLAQLLNAVKQQRTGKRGGAFTINEHGQVLCPTADGSYDRFYVGDCSGAITFVNPLDGSRFSLDQDRGLGPGDRWMLPYVGVPHKLSPDGWLHFVSHDGPDAEIMAPPVQDPVLIRALQRVRPATGMKFIVNPHGIVLTKVEEPLGVWRPTYVGRINYQKWFDRDDG